MFKKAIELMKRAFSFVKSRMTKKTVVIILSSVVGVAGLITGGVTLAKYAQDHNSDKLVELSNFYFESNLLKPTSANAEYNNGTNSITFELVNFDDTLRKSELDIHYEVTIKHADGSAVSATGTNTSGIISKDGEGRVVVTYEGLQYDTTYVVTARSTQPYVKEMSATFIIPSEDRTISPVIIDNGDYVSIIIETDNFTGNVNLTWQNGYVPDNSYKPLKDATTSPYTVTLESKYRYEFRFFKVQLGFEYDSSAFTVTVQ